jgi:SAM-dependent methyltransferase
MSNWNKLKMDDNFYNMEYWNWQSSNVDLGGKIQAEILFQDYIKTSDKVLDFGCGSGTTLRNLNCAEKVGFEINPYAVKYNIEQNHTNYDMLMLNLEKPYFSHL